MFSKPFKSNFKANLKQFSIIDRIVKVATGYIVALHMFDNTVWIILYGIVGIRPVLSFM